MRRSRIIMVCDKCLRASCWHGLFYCDDYVSAGTTTKTSAELRKLRREHPDYFSAKACIEHTGGLDYAAPVHTEEE